MIIIIILCANQPFFHTSYQLNLLTVPTKLRVVLGLMPSFMSNALSAVIREFSGAKIWSICLFIFNKASLLLISLIFKSSIAPGVFACFCFDYGWENPFSRCPFSSYYYWTYSVKSRMNYQLEFLGFI